MSEALEPKPGISRRTIVKAAAWSAPVIAVAVATPLASASITNDDTELSISNSGNIVVRSNSVGGVVDGQFSGAATVVNSGIAWQVDGATVSYSLAGPIVPASFTFAGSPITGSTISNAGYTWSVVVNEPNYLELQLLSPLPVTVPADGSVQVPFPTIAYATTLTAVATTANRVRAEATGTVYSGGDSLFDGNLKRFPA
jgi:hypothetical protein